LIGLAHQLIVGYEPRPDVIDELAEQADSLQKLRSLLWLHFDTRRQMEMLRVMEFLYLAQEASEIEFDREMDAFLRLDAVTEARIWAAIQNKDDSYTKFHQYRFFDQVRAVAAIRKKSFGHLESINVLDVGVMSVSSMYSEGIDGLRLFTTDHARRGNKNAEFGSPDFYPADLEMEELSVRYPELIGKFHVILFCEVLEHLKLAPQEILRDFKRLLAPGGMLYLTTPNGMGYGKFLAYFEGNNPADGFSRDNGDGHLLNFIHVREHTAREMIAGFAKAGMRIRYRAIREYFNMDSLWTTAFIGARTQLTYIADAE
jgi:Methyltransferase domain